MDLSSVYPRHGITRLADITGLDTLGVPVWSAIRPAARSYAVSAGKGLDPDHARLTAVMEAIETSCAEEWERLSVEHAAITQLSGHAAIVPFERLSKVRRAPDPDRPRHWVEGQTMDGTVWLAPYELVGVDARKETPWDTGAFVMTSAGTAAHWDSDRALTAALLEAIENDARALAMCSAASMARLPAVPLERGTPPGDLSATLWAKGMRPVMLDATNDLGFPVAFCLLGEDPDPAGLVPVRTFAGSACRRTWAEASLSALLEAVQARLTTIAGARDDVCKSDFMRGPAAKDPPRRRTAPPPDAASSAPGSIIDALLGKGMGQPIVFDLAPPGGPACLSVLVPGLSVRGGRSTWRMQQRVVGHALELF